MGYFRDLFTRWFGKPAVPARPDPTASPRPPRVKPPRPEKVTPLGDDSPLVAFTTGGMTTIMDLDAFDYTYGDADGPDPAQRDLDELWPRVNRVCVLAGALFRGRAMGGDVLLDLDDPEAIRGLAECLRIVEDPRTFNHCACLGGPVLELYAGPELAASLGLQHGKAIRWKRWFHDAQLLDGSRLDRWLTFQGVDAGHLRALYQRGDNFLMAEPEPVSERHREARERKKKARSLAGAGKLPQALAECDASLALHPETDTFGLRGVVHFHLNQFSEADADCTEAIRRGLRKAEVYFARAVVGDSRGQGEQALADCSMAILLDPGHAGAFNSRAFLLARLGRKEEALADFAEAVRLAPDWFLPYWNRVGVREEQGDADGIVADCSDVIRLLEQAGGADPKLVAAAHWRRGMAREARGEPALARADYDRALELHTDFPEALSARGWLHFREGRTDEAFADFTEVIRVAPDDGRAYAQRAQAHLARREWDRADADLGAGLEREPGAVYLHVQRAHARSQQGRLQEALADLTEAVRLEPGRPEGYVYRASLHGRLGDYDRETADLEAALAIDPRDAAACNLMAWHLATCPDPGRRDGAKALEYARRACECTEWKQPNYLDTLAAACAEKGQFDEACLRQEQALALFPEAVDRTPYQARLDTYRRRQPHREPAPPPGAPNP